MRSILMLAAALMPLALPALAADVFLKEIDDLPLPSGFVELPGGTLFEAPQGRIVEATIEGTMLEVEARSFFDDTLPELGWTRTGSDAYQRDKEVLRLEIATRGMQLDIHFSLTPIASSANADDKGAKP